MTAALFFFLTCKWLASFDQTKKNVASRIRGIKDREDLNRGWRNGQHTKLHKEHILIFPETQVFSKSSAVLLCLMMFSNSEI